MSKQAFALDVVLDRHRPEPLHAQIAQPLIQLIESGQLEAGTRLEDEITMAQRLDVSRPTARKALATLVNLGLIVRRRGAGTEVAPKQIRRPSRLSGLFEELQQAGHQPSTTILSWSMEVATPSIARNLQLQPDAEVLAVRRLRFSDDRPIAILHNYVPATLAPSERALEGGSLYGLMSDGGTQLAHATQRLGARAATAEEARLLNEPIGAALLTMQRTAYDSKHRPVDFGLHVFRGTLYTYEMNVSY